jgi:hypothetical protein
MTLAVPVVNSLTLVFTSLTSKLLGEKIGGICTFGDHEYLDFVLNFFADAIVGMTLILLGVTVCFNAGGV